MFDEFGQARFLGREPGQGEVESQQLLRTEFGIGNVGRGIERDHMLACATLVGHARSGMIDHDLAHGLGGKGKEMRSPLQIAACGLSEFEINLVHEAGRVQRVSARTGELEMRHLLQFGVYATEQGLQGRCISAASRLNQCRYVAHPTALLWPLNALSIGDAGSRRDFRANGVSFGRCASRNEQVTSRRRLAEYGRVPRGQMNSLETAWWRETTWPVSRTGALGIYGTDKFSGTPGSVPAPGSPGTATYIDSLNELGALQDNGGPTKTVAPSPPSTLIGGALDCSDANSNRIATDQRGRQRPPTGNRCDVGAFEFNEIFNGGFQ